MAIVIDKSRCVNCQVCVSMCPKNAIYVDDIGELQIKHEECTECELCLKMCPVRAITTI